ncbi:MAG: response regulator [Eubacteriales bacterium]|nr:response regulator [Eubacteriales bacterium]
MKSKQKINVFLLVLLSAAAILAGGFYYITSVQDSLWTETVTDILEVTAQGRHALDTYTEKELEMLHWLTEELSLADSRDENTIMDKMNLSGTSASDYICVNLDTGAVYDNQNESGQITDPDQLEVFRSLQGRGIREPFLDGRTGIWTLGYYERFSWTDGTEGLVQKTLPRLEIADRFSLSFYDNTGFSYVVNREGNILIRSLHRNSNRTFQNLFDIIDLQGNDTDEIQSFQTALKKGQKGVARFEYQKENYIFCYVPMENTADWYVVSIVPNRVIMEQANKIVRNSKGFFIVILGAVLIMTAFLILYRNSTQQILLAEENARKAAESANIAKSRFLSNMSHDIRTPMNAIIGMTRLASDHVEEPEKVREYLKNISLSGQLLVSLINDILDLSKIESGKMTLNNATASLEELMTGLVNIIQPTVANKKQNFNIRLHSIEHETLCFDSLRLNQVMLNLLSNAVKFTPDGGSVSVDVTESPSQKEGCAHFTFRVADTGIGMQPEFLNHIFDSFTREQDNRISKIEGSGLGMAITKMIVDIMEGTVVVESTPDRGSVFTVELDLLLPADVEIQEADMSLPPIRVLFADDDPDTRDSVWKFLTELGVKADIADSGSMAVEKVIRSHSDGNDYSLVLLDWKMPDISGLQAAQTIRRHTGYDIPVIIASAYDWDSIEKQAVEAGVAGFIQKPIFKSTLYHCIRQIVYHEECALQDKNEVLDLSGKCILLAEDNKLNQEIACELLSNLGAYVEVVDNGYKCTQAFRQSAPGHFDLILMDIHMPVMNGYEATEKIRKMERPDASSIPIFAMTADAFTEDIQEAKNAGMDAHLAKPLDIPAMMREIKKHLKL